MGKETDGTKGGLIIDRLDSSLKALRKSMLNDGEGFWTKWERKLVFEKETWENKRLKVTELLGEFDVLFKEPHELPPRRDEVMQYYLESHLNG